MYVLTKPNKGMYVLANPENVKQVEINPLGNWLAQPKEKKLMKVKQR